MEKWVKWGLPNPRPSKRGDTIKNPEKHNPLCLVPPNPLDVVFYRRKLDVKGPTGHLFGVAVSHAVTGIFIIDSLKRYLSA
jgi:hypothetical protein